VFLYQFYPETKGIDFIRTIFMNNYSGSLPFYENLEQTCRDNDFEWTTLLGDFFGRCYFCGDRAAEGMFLKDAPLFVTWKHTNVNTDAPDFFTFSSVKEAPAYGMVLYSYLYHPTMSDTLTIDYECFDFLPDASGQNYWELRILPLKNNTLVTDSIVSISPTGNGKGRFSLYNWSEHDKVVVFAANAYSQAPRQIRVTFTTSPKETPVALRTPGRLLPPEAAIESGRILTVNGSLAYSFDSTEPSAFSARVGSGATPLSIVLPQKRLAPGSYFMTIDYRLPGSSSKRIILPVLLVSPRL
jgi:hypothetical protein